MISEVHRMTLRQPWECSRTTDATVYCRGFGRPRQLAADEFAMLQVGPFPAEATVSLNGGPSDPVPLHSSLLIPLTQPMVPRYKLEVHFGADFEAPPGFTPTVAVVIYSETTDPSC